MKRIWAVGLCAVLSVSLAGCQKAQEPKPAAQAEASPLLTSPANVDAERLAKADSEPGQWLTYGGNYSEQRFARLKQIDTSNVKNLGLAWFADYDTNMQQTGSPLFVDGILYVSTAWSRVYAYDAKTGKQLWYYNPKVPGEWAQRVCCGLVNRGLAAWNGKIYVGTLDARLVALDAKTGKETWSTIVLDEAHRTDALQRYSLTMAPRVVKGKVIIGPSGGEFGVRGFIAAYDAESGKEVWRFNTVPGDPSKPFENEAMKKAAATWSGDWWKVGGGGTVWDAAVYDASNDLLIFGTGNGTPWNQRDRDPKGGDNLYIASIVAIRPDSGEYVWHYQTTPGDTWDYDAVSPMTIADITIGGKPEHVVLQPSKNGFFYVLQAATGKLLLAEPFTTMNWSKGVDRKTGRPIEVKGARYPLGTTWNLAPGVQGAHGWHSNAYSPDTGLMYVPTQDAYFPMSEDPKYVRTDVGYNLGIDFGAQATYYRANPKAPSSFVGYLQAIDPATGKRVWKAEDNKNGPTGGALATAGGLVFSGNGADQELRAFDAKSGAKLWSFEAQTGVLAAPISFEMDGKQYIAASVGGNQMGGYYAPNYSRMLVFSLDGKAALPAPQPYTPRALDPPAQAADAATVAKGKELYSKYCAACHGENGQTRGATFPDLTRTPLLHTQAGFDGVVLGGVLKDRGMASFDPVLDPPDSQAILAFVVSRAIELKNQPGTAAGPGGAPPPAPRAAGAHEEK